MNSPFIFSRPLQANEAIGRQDNVNWLSSNLCRSQNSIIWDADGLGKRTLINQALFLVQKNQKNTRVCRVNLFNVVSCASLYCSIAHQVFACFANTLSEWENLTGLFLPRSQPRIICREDQINAIRFEFGAALDTAAIEELAQVPAKVSAHFKKSLIVVLENFQHISDMRDIKGRLPAMARLWKKSGSVVYLLCGSSQSAYGRLFDSGKPFYKFGERIVLSPIKEKLFTEYIIRSFAKAGRVISKDLSEQIYETMEGHPFYCQYFANICFINTRGYLNDAIYNNSFEELLTTFQSRFEQICSELSFHQIYYLKAMVDNIERFSSSEVLDSYHLHSSANVFRVRTALEKKNIIYIHRGQPRFIDPLFKIWFSLRYCNTYWL